MFSKKPPKPKKEERFEYIFNQFIDGHYHTILLDKETGVNYLVCSFNSGSGGGLGITPLLDSSGKPIVTKKEEE